MKYALRHASGSGSFAKGTGVMVKRLFRLSEALTEITEGENDLERELLYQNPLAGSLPSFRNLWRTSIGTSGFVYLMESLPMKEIMDARRILITGCGDSYAAGIAMKPLLEEMLQMPVDVMRAVEFSRHLPFSCLEEGPGSPLVVLISVSGTVTRILEAAQRANLHGANTLAITASRSTPLAKECRRALELNPPEVERAPGCGAYVACCHALLALGIRMGRVRNSYVPAMEMSTGRVRWSISGSSHQKYSCPLPGRCMRWHSSGRIWPHSTL